MKKLLSLLFVLCAAVSLANAQASGVGQIGCNAAPITGTPWNSGTANNTSQTLASNVAGGYLVVTIDQTTTLTAGAVTFQGDPGDGNIVQLAPWQVLDATINTFPQISNPYTLQASTNRMFLVQTGGMYKIILKLTTAITGTGAITPVTVPYCGVVQTLTNTDPCQANVGSLATINLTAGGQVITGTALKQTYICALDLVTATAQNIALVEGTGTTCATSIAGMAGGTTAATGWNFSANGGIAKGTGLTWIYKTAAAADNVCLLLSGSGQTSGAIRYVQQ